VTASRFALPRRIVVKIGSSSLCTESGGLDGHLVMDLCTQIATLREQQIEVVLVSSGAVAAGLDPLGLLRRPTDLPRLQAAASVGQGILMHTYQASFALHGLVCGQVLLTPSDVVDRTRYLNARNTFETLLDLGAVPVVNENDTVATDELRFGDNDRLAALVASMLGADVLLLLSDVNGLLDGDPRRDNDLSIVERVDDLSALGIHHYGDPSELGSGGIRAKIEAARIATFSGAHAVIANARRPGVLCEVVAGAHIGTWFPLAQQRPSKRKLWIAFAPIPHGAVIVDRGAVRAVVERGSSLLAAGVVDATGDFEAGDAVDVVGPDDRVVARGLVSYDRYDVLRVRGRSTKLLTKELGPAYRRAVIHRDSLVVTA
jgi:glutamate 5-kinase